MGLVKIISKRVQPGGAPREMAFPRLEQRAYSQQRGSTERHQRPLGGDARVNAQCGEIIIESFRLAEIMSRLP